jgi:DNA ligase (NAD+)
MDSKRAKLLKLTELGFGKVRTIQYTGGTQDVLELHIQCLKQKAEDDDLPIDGLVLSYDEIAFSRSCGRTGHHYKDGLSFKFEDDLLESILRSVEWNPSRSGEITPVAIFDTVEIDGCEVSRASLHNLSFIEDLELMPATGY